MATTKTVSDLRSALLVRMVTEITDTILYYEVQVDGDFGSGFNEERVIWTREVPLMQTAAYRAGGYHATAAAREQEKVAVKAAAKVTP
jgi:hypothetical protein